MKLLLENWRRFLNEKSDSYPLGEEDDVRAVAKALIFNEDGEILILKRASHMKWNPDLWDLPGGHLKEDEEIIAALKREVKEETGLTIKNIVEINNVTIFKSEVSGKDKKIKLDDENKDHKWVKPEDIPDDFVSFLKSHIRDQ
jgi:8-oxo-dGTP pyrophosphatase MutT (NUDIX family)